MEIRINDKTKLYKGLLDELSLHKEILDKAHTHEEYYSLLKLERYFLDNSFKTKFEMFDTNDFKDFLNKHEFRSLNSSTSHRPSNNTENFFKYSNGILSFKCFVNGSYTPIVINYSNREKEWNIHSELFKRRKNPDRFLNYFKDLLTLVEVVINK